MKMKSTSSAPELVFLLALLLLAAPSPAQVPAKAPGQLTGSATDWNKIYITAPANINNWVLTHGITNIISGTLNVDSTGSWAVKVKDENPTTSGRMTKYDIRARTYDTSVKLSSPMIISAAGGTEVTLSTTDQQILTGGSTPQGGQDVTIFFKQPASSNEQVLGIGYKYRLVVTFTGSLTG